jgi:enoyl-[acyl-carrier protein] reductase I
MSTFEKNTWTLIVGGSSGIGLATAKKLAAHGMNLIIIHKDRRSTLQIAEKAFDEFRDLGIECITFNQDGATKAGIESLVTEIEAVLSKHNAKLHTILHSIAWGNLKPLVSQDEEAEPYLTGHPAIDQFFQEKDATTTQGILGIKDFELTLQMMALSFSEWIQQLISKNALAKNSRILALTSEGDKKVWGSYAAVGVAKSALETLMKYYAIELAPRDITVNLIQAGITDTPSLNLIPGSDFLKKMTLQRNPNKRLTTPQDIANVVYLLSLPEARWINGTTIVADGGEQLS